MLLRTDGSVSLSVCIGSDVEDLLVASRGVHRERLLLLIIDLADRARAEEILGRLFLQNLDLGWATGPHCLLSTHENGLASRRIGMFLIANGWDLQPTVIVQPQGLL